MTNAIEIENLDFRYGQRLMLEKINLDVPEGDFLGIIGPNGSGKTTLLKILLGLLSPNQGRIRIFGRSPEECRQRIGYVPQYFQFDRDFPISVYEVVLMGRLGRAPLFGPYRKEDRQAADEALQKVEISDLRQNKLSHLSGGQLQRVMIARALASRPKVLLLDEPTSSVDTRAERGIYDLLQKLNEETTIVLVTHDLGFITSYVKRVACLNRKLVCHPTSRLTQEMVEELYHGPVHIIHHEDHCDGKIRRPGEDIQPE
jgi:zinc transport system ATP-binding protein